MDAFRGTKNATARRPHGATRRMAVRGGLTSVLIASLALVLGACATNTPPPDDDGTGALVVLVEGLPTGAAGDVTITGPDGFNESIVASDTFAGLEPGNYSVGATDVSHQGIDYAATVTGSPANVTSDDVTTVTVTYAATSTEPGDLIVTVTGLPGGVDAAVNVTGPDGFDQDLTGSTTLGNVDPGLYVVSANDVDDGGDTYAATVSGSPATVPAGGSATVTVEYTFLDPATFGTLQVNITGLPVGTDADVNVSGPGAFDQDLTATTTIPNLVPANYTITAADVSTGGLTYSAVIDTSPALVLPNETTTVDVTYQPFVPDDGDAASAPGVFALFRNTSAGPLTVNELLFNENDPLDVKGIQLVNELGDPEDPGDWLAFELVHGESPTTSVNVSLECDTEFTPGSPIRVELRDDSGAKIGNTVTCDGENDIAVPNDGGTGDYLLHVIPQTSNPFYVAYVLSVDAFCFQACAYQPYLP